MKPVYATLRQKGHTNTGYIDDSLLTADSFEECQTNVKDTVYLMTHVGFVIHEKKSVLVPTTKILFLGNWINSVSIMKTCLFKYTENFATKKMKIFR